MKILMTYYSYSGITDKVVRIFADAMRTKGDVDVRRLKPKNEMNGFAAQCKAAFTRQRAELEDGAVYDVSPYDIILVGSPVWVFAPTPAVNAYLDRVSGLNGKRVIVLLTSGSGLGVKRCFAAIRYVLQGKGASRVDEINIPNSRMGGKDSIVSPLEKLM